MSAENLLIVESPAKAKTINKYLGRDFRVLSSFGHVRDLPPKDGSVRPDEDFAMDWELGDRAKKHVDEIVAAAKQAKMLYLATDPDREGEAIAWHINEILKTKRLPSKPTIRRVTFNEITKKAVQSAITAPRDIDENLVEAYLARRALDHLIGFTLSPILWRKLPGAKSAGRVQSVALRLICERETEIEKFLPREYWTVGAKFLTHDNQMVTAGLRMLNGQKIEKFTLATEKEAKDAAAIIEKHNFSVKAIERKQVRRNPYAPFTTSTLQQEASRKLGFGATRTMRTAQRLYEGVDVAGDTVGLITYMRTDGVTVSQESIEATRKLIGSAYGDKYLPSSPRIYKKVAKNAQEAHEAIRPTDVSRRPEDVAQYLEGDELRLYELIWKRAVAAQMESAVIDQVAVDIASADGTTVLRATGSVIVFDGFLRIYREDVDDSDGEEDGGARLPPMNEGDALRRESVTTEQHFTQPPPRYTEASLVKKLEELGIGRPSTYASIMQVLQERNYVRLDQKRFIPEDRGRIVTAFLESFFGKYVEYGFTADLEEKLDDISGGRVNWKEVLRQFWTDFFATIEKTKDLTITQVIDALDADLEAHFFPKKESRVCPSCKVGRLGLKLSRYGAFIGCSRYPDCSYTAQLASMAGGDAHEGTPPQVSEGPRLLGTDPATGMPVTVRQGPYGDYVQLGPKPGEAKTVDKKRKKGEKKEKPKRASLPKGVTYADVDLEKALALLSLPRELGKHPETGEVIIASTGRFGPYVKHGTTYKSLKEGDDVLTIDLERAVALLAEPSTGRGGRFAKAPAGVELGKHPELGQPIMLMDGRYGPYVKCGKTMASLPKGMEKSELTLEQAVKLIDEKAAKGGGTVKKLRRTRSKIKDDKPAKKARTIRET